MYGSLQHGTVSVPFIHRFIHSFMAYSNADLQKDQTQGADIAAAAITITSGREKYVNFLKPFQNLGFSVVIKRPDPEFALTYTFSIFQPFDPALWGLISLSVVVVSLI